MTGAVLWNVDLSNISVKPINSLELHVLWKLKDNRTPVKTNPFCHCQSLLPSHSLPSLTLPSSFLSSPLPLLFHSFSSPLLYYSLLLPLLFALPLFPCLAHWQSKNTLEVLRTEILYQIIFKEDCFKVVLQEYTSSWFTMCPIKSGHIWNSSS